MGAATLNAGQNIVVNKYIGMQIYLPYLQVNVWQPWVPALLVTKAGNPAWESSNSQALFYSKKQSFQR